MAFNLGESDYPFMFKPPQYHHVEKANSTVSVASSTANNKKTVKIYLEQREEALRHIKGNKSTDIMGINISSRDFHENHSWFLTFIGKKNKVICEGKMKSLTLLMTEIPDLVDDIERTPVDTQMLRDILIFIQMLKDVIVNYSDLNPDLVHFNGCLTEILAKYCNMNIVIMQNMDLANLKNQKLYKQRAMSWMTHIAFHCDFSLDRICEAILKTKGIRHCQPAILGELVVGLIEYSIRHMYRLQRKEMDTLTFVRVILVFKRVIRWYRIYVSQFMIEEVVRKRVEFASENIVPPSNLKEVLLVLSTHMYGALPSTPLCPSDKTVMTLLLTSEYKTSKVLEQLEDLLCNQNRLALFALDAREGRLQFPVHCLQSAYWRSACLAGWSMEAEPRLSCTEEERLAAFSLQPLHERATGADFPHRRLCLTPTLGDLSPLEPAAAAAGGYNPQSVRSVDSDSSLKISSTTAADLDHLMAKSSGEDELLRSVRLKMVKVPLPNLITAYLTVVHPNGTQQALTPCFMMDDREGRRKGGAAAYPLRHAAHQELSEDTSADEDSGCFRMRSVPQSTNSAATVKRGAARSTQPRAVKKRKADADSESVPDKRPRLCSASHLDTPPTSLPEASSPLPPSTPVKSVIQKAKGKVVWTSAAAEKVASPHVLHDPLSRPAEVGPGKAGSAQEGPLGPGTYNPTHYYYDDDQLPPVSSVFDMGEQLMDTMPLYEVEGNTSNYQNGPPSSHHLSRDPGASVLESSGGAPMFRRDMSPQMGDPLLNNCQNDVVDAPLSNKPPAPTPAPQSGGLGVNRIESQQGFYEDEDCLKYLTDDYLTLGESHSCNEMSDDGKFNPRSSKPLDRTGRRTVPAAKKTAAATVTSLRQYTQQVRATTRAAPDSSPPLSSALPGPSPAKNSKAGAAPSRTSLSRENSVEPSPAPVTKEPDKTADWVNGGGGSESVLAQLMSHVPPGPAHEKLSECIKKASRKSRQSEDARLSESRGSNASLTPASHSTNCMDASPGASHSTNCIDASPGASHSTNCIDASPAVSHRTNRTGESPRALSVGPHPKKTGGRNAPPPPAPHLRSPSPPPPVVVPGKRQRGRPRKKSPRGNAASAKRAAAAAAARSHKDEGAGSADEMAAPEASQTAGKKLRRRGKKGDADPVSVIQRSEGRLNNHEILDALSRKLNGDRDVSGSDVEEEDYGSETQSHTIRILQRAVEKVTENLTKKA